MFVGTCIRRLSNPPVTSKLRSVNFAQDVLSRCIDISLQQVGLSLCCHLDNIAAFNSVWFVCYISRSLPCHVCWGFHERYRLNPNSLYFRVCDVCVFYQRLRKHCVKCNNPIKLVGNNEIWIETPEPILNKNGFNRLRGVRPIEHGANLSTKASGFRENV